MLSEGRLGAWRGPFARGLSPSLTPCHPGIRVRCVSWPQPRDLSLAPEDLRGGWGRENN